MEAVWWCYSCKGLVTYNDTTSCRARKAPGCLQRIHPSIANASDTNDPRILSVVQLTCRSCSRAVWAARKALGWPSTGRLAHAFGWEIRPRTAGVGPTPLASIFASFQYFTLEFTLGKARLYPNLPATPGHPPSPARSRGAARRARPAVPRTFTFRPELNSPSVRLGSDKDKLRYEHSDRLFIWPLCGLVDRTE
jgi:hypothetical protein